MANHFIKIKTVNGEKRWINLARVTRVTMVDAKNEDPLLAFCFDGEDRVVIHGATNDDRDLIQRITQQLDAMMCEGKLAFAA